VKKPEIEKQQNTSSTHHGTPSTSSAGTVPYGPRYLLVWSRPETSLASQTEPGSGSSDQDPAERSPARTLVVVPGWRDLYNVQLRGSTCGRRAGRSSCHYLGVASDTHDGEIHLCTAIGRGRGACRRAAGGGCTEGRCGYHLQYASYHQGLQNEMSDNGQCR